MKDIQDYKKIINDLKDFNKIMENLKPYLKFPGVEIKTHLPYETEQSYY